MQRAMVIMTAVVVVGAAAAFRLRGHFAEVQETEGEPMGGEKVVKTDAEWRQQLSDEEYRVTRKHGTERAFTGRYWNSKEDGTYGCVCCGQSLFDSETKFESGTGW